MKKSKKSETTNPVALDEFVPSTYISLEKDQVKQLKDIELGDKVRVTIVGKVIGLNSRKSTRSDESGSIDIERPDIKIEGDDSSTWTQMAEDD